MADRRSLLQRLRPEMQRTSAASAVRDDVVQSLRAMLRTRLGSAPSTEGYGLPDLTDAIRSQGDIAADIGRVLKWSIETFEPRLVNVRVSHSPGETWDQKLRFEVSAELVIDRVRHGVVFETRIDPSRRVIIR
jgi:type VI secretion system protein